MRRGSRELSSVGSARPREPTQRRRAGRQEPAARRGDPPLRTGGGHINPTWFAALAAGIKVIDVRHEAAAAHAAEGWALATGEPGVCVVTAGPGLTNALTGLANAFANGSPMVCLAGSATLRGQDTGEVEALDQLELVRPVTKWARRVYHLDRIPEYVAMAFRHARSGRPGPVYLEIPIDTAHSDVSASDVTFPPLLVPDQRPGPSAALVARAAELLAHAERPAIVAGSGVWWSGASEQLRTFVEHTRIPVVTRQSGRGTVPDDHPLCFGNDWQNVVYRADVVLVIGKQLDYFFGYGFFPHLEHLIQVDINPGEIGRNRVPVSVGIVADARATLTELGEAMKPLETAAWVAALRASASAIADGKARLGPVRAGPAPPDAGVLGAPALPRRDATVIADASNMLMWANASLAAYEPGRMPAMGNLGTIGHGIGFAIAAASPGPDPKSFGWWATARSDSTPWSSTPRPASAYRSSPSSSTTGVGAGWVPLGNSPLRAHGRGVRRHGGFRRASRGDRSRARRRLLVGYAVDRQCDGRAAAGVFRRPISGS